MLLKLADTVLILINTGPSNVNRHWIDTWNSNPKWILQQGHVTPLQKHMNVMIAKKVTVMQIVWVEEQEIILQFSQIHSNRLKWLVLRSHFGWNRYLSGVPNKRTCAFIKSGKKIHSLYLNFTLPKSRL